MGKTCSCFEEIKNEKNKKIINGIEPTNNVESTNNLSRGIINYVEMYKNYNMNTAKYMFDNKYISVCRIIDIYDGDTCKIAMIMNGNVYKFDVRLDEIDTPEIKSKSNSEKKEAIKARDRLFNLVTKNDSKNLSRNEIRKILTDNIFLAEIEVQNYDKYGRLLAKLFHHNINKNENEKKSFSDILIEEGFANMYNGGTKEEFNFE
jgi:endonuclease YncB( thermonuclease family)